MSALIFVERIETAMDVIEINSERAVPVPPNAILSSEARHGLVCDQRHWREVHDEILTQVEEIRAARAGFSQMLQGLEVGPRREFDEQYRQRIKPPELQEFLKKANKRLKEIRELRNKMDGLLRDGPGNGGGRKNIVLPKLNLKEFDGTNWQDFWPLFESTIHADIELDHVQKMSYLDSLLRGEAKKVIQGLLPFSRENYNLATSLLKDRYGKNENLIRDLHNQLARLQQSKSLVDDMKLQLELERVCRQLEHHDQDLSSPQIYLSLEQKLSKKVLVRYVDLKTARLSALPPEAKWSTTLFRETFKASVEQLQQVKDIVQRSHGPSDFGSKRERQEVEDRESTLNLAVRYRDQDQKRFNSNPNAVKRNQERNRSSSPENASSRSSSNSNSRSPARRVGSPWPRAARGQGTRQVRDTRQSRRNDNARNNNARNSSPSASRSRSPSRYPCQLCSELHFALDCSKFRTIAERRKQIEFKLLCYVCLFKGHMAKDCPRRQRRCFLCQRPGHHPALCEKRKAQMGEQSTATAAMSHGRSEERQNPDTQVNSLQSCLRDPKEVWSLLKCVRVTAYHPMHPKRSKLVLAFLDDGSEKSYIAKSLVEELGLMKVDEVAFKANGLAGLELGEFLTPVVELGLHGAELDMNIQARQLDKVMPTLPHIEMKQAAIEKILANKIKMSPKFEEPLILIGGDFYNQLSVTPIEQLANGFWISGSKLGDIISGEGRIAARNRSSTNVASTSREEKAVELASEFGGDEGLNSMVNIHNQLETIGLGDASERDDNSKWIKDFEEKLRFNGERYEVRLSWKEEVEQLPDNYYLALGRLKSNYKKLNEKPSLLKQYDEIIQEQLKRGMIERVDEIESYPRARTRESGESSEVLHYLPHHFVERQDKQSPKSELFSTQVQEAEKESRA